MPILAIIILAAIDQYTKYLALSYLKSIETIVLIPNLFSLTFVENTGAAFGILQGQRWLFVLLTISILIGMFIYYRSLPTEYPYNYLRFSLILVAGGAIGNFIDRLLRGSVVDFFHFTLIDFPVFNVADCYVCVGAAIIGFLLIFVIKD